MDDPLEVPVQKLGHPVLEVRTWAFFSLLSKLECEIISLEQLTENEEIIGKLVQWMKHEKCSQRDKILELLYSLILHDSKNIKKLLPFDPELLSLKRLQKVEQHQEIVTNIINRIVQSGVKKDVCTDTVFELHWTESNRLAFEELFSSYQLPADSLVDSDIHVLTQWELGFDSEHSRLSHNASVQFTTNLIRDFHIQSFLQHSNLMKILVKKLNDVNSMNTIKYTLECVSACVLDIEEQLRSKEVLSTLEKPDQTYCRVTIPFLYLSLLDSLLPHVKLAAKLGLRIIRALASGVKSVQALWNSSSLIGSQFCSGLMSTLRALCEKSNECRDPFTKLQLFLLISALIQNLLPRRGLASYLPGNIQEWMCSQVSRPDLYYLYPDLIQPWYELCATEFPENKELNIFKSILHIKSCLTSAIDCLHHGDKTPASQYLESLFDSLPSLYFHRDTCIVQGFFRVCKHNVLEDSDDLLHARQILLSLLSCSDNMQQETYSQLDTFMQSILIESTSQSSIDNPSDSAVRGDPVRRLQFMLDTDVLIELLCQGARSDNKKIRSHARNVLQSLLSSRVSVTMATWSQLLTSLSPVLCLLQCMVDATDPLGVEIMQLTHPDLAKDLRVSKLQILKCNACLLYHKDPSIRLEATARLAWITRYPGSVTSLLADLCVTGCSKSSLLVDVYEESSVTRVLELLTMSSRGSSSGLDEEESRVRFSCLTQLSVMMDDVKLHRVFIERGGVRLLEREVHELVRSKLDDSNKRKQSIACCVRALHNVCANNSSVRQYLSSEYSFLVDVIKVLFQFDSCHSDSVQLLFILLYADLIMNSDSNGAVVSVPALVRDMLHVPEHFTGTHWSNSPHTLLDDSESLLSHEHGKHHLIIHWNLHQTYAGDIYKMLRGELSKHINDPSTGAASQTNNRENENPNRERTRGEMFQTFEREKNLSTSRTSENSQESQVSKRNKDRTIGGTSKALVLSEDLLRLLRRASVVENCNASLKTIRTTSSYCEAYTAVSSLQRYLDLQHIENVMELNKLPFCSVLNRYLEPSPSSIQDEQLLLLLLSVVQSLPDSQLEWVSHLLVSKQTLLSLIHPQSNNLTQHSHLCVHLLNLVRKIMVTHPSCLPNYGSLTQSVLMCIDNHSQLDASMLTSCLDYLCDILYLSEDSKGLDSECLWNLLASTPMENTRVRSDVACKVLMCLDMTLGSKLNDSVALGVWQSEMNFPALQSCLSQGQGSVKAAAYHLLSGLCSTRSSVCWVVHNMAGLVDRALSDIVAGGADLATTQAATMCAHLVSFSNSELLLRKCIEEDFFSKLLPIVSNPRSASLKTAVCHLVNNLFNLNPSLLANTDAMVQLVGVLIREIVNSSSNSLNDGKTKYCSAMCRILTQYYSLNLDTPILSDKFHAALIYMLNASSYEQDISIFARDTLWQCILSLLSSLLPPPLPPIVISTLCYCLKNQSVKTARSILATLPKLVPHMNPDNLEPLCHVVYSAWSRRFKPCPVVLNAVLALTAGHRNQCFSNCGPLLVLEYDLLDDVHERLKQLYVSLECSHGDSVVVTDMDIYLQLLNNILAQNTRVCEIAAKSGLADTLHKLLGWVMSSDSTLHCLLQVLKTFATNCLPACASCVHTSTILGAGLSKSSSSSSLVHSLISLVVMSSSHNAGVRVQTLAVLANLVATNECRLIVSKSSLLDHFIDMTLNRKLSVSLEIAWIAFLKSYSFHLSQYNNTIENPHFIGTLVDKTYRNLHYLTILTNLTFHGVYQTKLSGHGKFLKLVQDILGNSESISVYKCARAVRAKINGEIDGEKEDIRAINEKLFSKYFELLLFDKTLHRDRRRKISGPSKPSRDSRQSGGKLELSGDGKVEDRSKSKTEFLHDISLETQRTQIRTRKKETNSSIQHATQNTCYDEEIANVTESSRNTSARTSNSFESEPSPQSYESYRNYTNLSDTKRSDTIEKFVKLVKSKGEDVAIKTVLGHMAKSPANRSVSNEIATLLDLAQAFDTRLTQELSKVAKRNAVLIVWNLSANNYRMKLNFRHVGLVSCLQDAVKADEEFAEEIACVLDMLLS